MVSVCQVRGFDLVDEGADDQAGAMQEGQVEVSLLYLGEREGRSFACPRGRQIRDAAAGLGQDSCDTITKTSVSLLPIIHF